MSKATLTILGSGSAMPNPGRNASGYLLQAGESLNLLDAGSGVAASFMRCGFDPLKLDRIFISHTHADHVADLPTIIQMLHALSTRRRLDLYVPEDFVAPLQSYLVALYLIPERLRVDLQIHGYTASVVHDDDFQLEAFGNSHMTKYTDEFRQYGYAHGMASYGFEISVERSRLFYSGDIGSFDDVRDRLADFDLAVLEAFHVDADELLGFIPQSNVKQYVLSHLGDTESVSELSNKIAVRKLSNVAIAEDGQRWNM